jgi:hypothetical protein
MSKKASQENLKKFREDLQLVKKIYPNVEIAQKLNIDPANLSSFSTGSKNPGESFLNTFYMNFSTEINEQNDKQQAASVPYDHESELKAVQEAAIKYLPNNELQEHKTTLKENNTHLFGYVNRALDITQSMVAVQKQMAESSHILIKSNEKMVNFYFPDGGQPPKPKENSPEENK